jgi:DNA-binding response OmpR family regulator
VLEQDGIVLDVARHAASRDGLPLSLSPKEYAVLHVLMRAGGRVVSTEDLLEQAWDEHTDPFTNTVRTTVMTLRRKLGEPSPIATVPRVGYRLGS